MRALVTGGGGFLGRAIVRQLLARGDEVLVLGRNRYPEVEALGARGIVWDLAKGADGLETHLEGVDRVFHTAAKAGVWGMESEYQSINVDGTRNIVTAARKAGVGGFVYTGSPSCTFDGGDAEGLTEADCPYPQHFEAIYPRTKAEAELFVTTVNDERMPTTALRPHLIWGPEDPHLLPRIIQRNRQGRLAIVGDGKNEVGLTYVENAAAAHLQAADALAPGSDNAGKAYFVTDPRPVVLWEWLAHFLEALGEPPIRRRVPTWLARGAGAVLESVWATFGLDGEPPMTRFVASQLATSHWYDLSGARRDFGLAPVVPPDEAWETTVRWFREEWRP